MKINVNSVSAQTLALLNEIEALHYFHSVGQSAPGSSVRDWAHAVELASGEQWFSLCDTARYAIQCKVSDSGWNLKVRFLRGRLMEVSVRVQEELIQNRIDPTLATRICDELRSQLLMICLETETQDLHNLRLFQSIWNWLKRGHFPCSWDGHYPTGSLVVY